MGVLNFNVIRRGVGPVSIDQITDGTSTTIFCGELAGRPDYLAKGRESRHPRRLCTLAQRRRMLELHRQRLDDTRSVRRSTARHRLQPPAAEAHSDRRSPGLLHQLHEL